MNKTIKYIWGGWLKLGHVIGNFQSQIILTIFYFTFLLPIGLILSFLQDQLILRTKRQSGFSKFEYSDKSANDSQKQY